MPDFPDLEDVVVLDSWALEPVTPFPTPTPATSLVLDDDILIVHAIEEGDDFMRVPLSSYTGRMQSQEGVPS